jgi:GNAT superfamily N-acetyltransferase
MRAQIRQAAAEDLERILEMALRFVSETKYRGLIEISPEALTKTVCALAANPDGAIFVSEAEEHITGMIALLVFDHPYSGVRTASEMVWWVEPESRGVGLRLLDAAEEWARGGGAEIMQMVAPTEAIGRLYERLGYKPVETSYQRRL